MQSRDCSNRNIFNHKYELYYFHEKELWFLQFRNCLGTAGNTVRCCKTKNGDYWFVTSQSFTIIMLVNFWLNVIVTYDLCVKTKSEKKKNKRGTWTVILITTDSTLLWNVLIISFKMWPLNPRNYFQETISWPNKFWKHNELNPISS